MVKLSFIEEIKDKATRLIPTPYMEIVEECTASHLLIPTYEHVKFLCETVNKKPETIVDVVRALRRRIACPDVAIQHLTIQLLESMIKSCSTSFHIEVASQKGLLRDLVTAACVQPTTGRAMQAKEAALLLTLNLSIWFRGHPAEESYILTTLADDVRNQLGPNCFEGLKPESNTRMKVEVYAANRNRQQLDVRASGDHKVHGTRSQGHRRQKHHIVDAIPIDLPTSERVSAMLEACMSFSEYVNNTELNREVSLREDEVVQSYLSQVREDHIYVTILLSSNLQVDRDLLRTVADSQSAVLAKVEKSTSRPRVDAMLEKKSTLPPVPQQTLVRSAGDTEQQYSNSSTWQGTTIPPRLTPPHAKVPSENTNVTSSSPVPVAAPPASSAVSEANLFGEMQPEPQVAESMYIPPESSSTEQVSAAAPVPPAALHEETAPVAGPALESSVEPTPNFVDAAAPLSSIGAEAGEGVKEEEAPVSASTVDPSSAPALTAATLNGDDDFDAFLEGRTSG
nr:unnamed protein product [Leishmania braziliensis]